MRRRVGRFAFWGLASYTPEHRHSHHHWLAHFCDLSPRAEQQEAITRAANLVIEEDRMVLAVNQQHIDSRLVRESLMLAGDKAAIPMRRQNKVLLEQAGQFEEAETAR